MAELGIGWRAISASNPKLEYNFKAITALRDICPPTNTKFKLDCFFLRRSKS
jgi:hypothetical protein